MPDKPKYLRILLKLSGEALATPLDSICGGTVKGGDFGISPEMLSYVADEVRSVKELGVQTGIVIGGGNFFRGAGMKDVERSKADQIGMLATVINSLALQDALAKKGISSSVQSAVDMGTFTEPFNREKAIRYFEKDLAVIFAAGTGNPYFTTDTAATLRALEINADILLKATKVDGVYDSDPKKNPDARFFKSLTYSEVLEQQLKVMDLTAISLAIDHGLPMSVFNLFGKGNIRRVVCGEDEGTRIGG